MFQDLKFAWRRLRHAPGFAAVAMLTLAVAVGANTAILSIADGVLFRPLPYDDADRLSIIQMLSTRTGTQSTSVNLEDLRLIDERHGGLGRTAALESGPTIQLDTPDGAVRVPTIAATANYFEVVGVRAARGRLFTGSDAQDPGRAVVLSHASWRQRFGGDEDIVGRSITLGGSTFDVIGVLPADFVFPRVFPGKPELIAVAAPITPDTTGGRFYPIVRLEPGVSREQAQAELEALAAEIGRVDPDRADSVPYLNEVRTALYPFGRPVMQFLLVAAMLVLLIGCANLATMLLAR